LYSSQLPIHAPPHQKFHSTNFDNHGTHHSNRHYGGHCTNGTNLLGIISTTKSLTKHSQVRNWENLINSFNLSSMGMRQEKLDITSKLQIMGSLCDNANILMHLQDQGTIF
jgi:hypothetical protein